MESDTRILVARFRMNFACPIPYRRASGDIPFRAWHRVSCWPRAGRRRFGVGSPFGTADFMGWNSVPAPVYHKVGEEHVASHAGLEAVDIELHDRTTDSCPGRSSGYSLLAGQDCGPTPSRTGIDVGLKAVRMVP